MSNKSSKMRFFEFSQNNSGRSFKTNEAEGIGSRVYIEARTANEANEKAERIGIYFDGVDVGRDCACCGDRWFRASEDSAEKKIVLNEVYSFNWHPFVYVHHADLKRGFSAISKDGVGDFFTIERAA